MPSSDQNKLNCSDVETLMVEYLDGSLDQNLHQQMTEQIDSCANCQQTLADISEMRATVESWSTNWHDETPPAWEVPQSEVSNPLEPFLEGFRQWFPTFASATALVLVSVLYVQSPESTPGQINASQLAEYNALPELPQATQAAFDNALEDNRAQRQRELESLLEILTAEMNRRSLETEESLRYVVTSQVQGQREMDQLYQQVERLLAESDRDNQGGREVDPTQSRLIGGVTQ